jgi:hypothetical protein
MKRIVTLWDRMQRYDDEVCPFDPPIGCDYDNNRTKNLACRWHKRHTLRVNGLTREISRLRTSHKRIGKQKETKRMRKQAKRKKSKKQTIKMKPETKRKAIMATEIHGVQAVAAVVMTHSIK